MMKIISLLILLALFFIPAVHAGILQEMPFATHHPSFSSIEDWQKSH
ncbi:MAG: hypothetical protein ACOX5R_19020 [bacterium]|jgi:hypothetical protein